MWTPRSRNPLVRLTDSLMMWLAWHRPRLAFALAPVYVRVQALDPPAAWGVWLDRAEVFACHLEAYGKLARAGDPEAIARLTRYDELQALGIVVCERIEPAVARWHAEQGRRYWRALDYRSLAVDEPR